MDSTDTRRANRGAVLAEVISRGPISRSSLATYTGLSKATVSRVVDRLVLEKLVIEQAPVTNGQAGGQQRPVRFAADGGVVCGVDLGASNTRLVVTDLLGRVLSRKRVATPASQSADNMSRWLAAEVRDLAGSKAAALRMTAIGVPGVVDPAGGVIRAAQNLRQVEDEAMFAGVRAALPGHVLVDNDANFAVLGELRFGAARGRDTVVMITIGTSIGAGVVLNSRLARGRSGFIGEFSFLRLPDGGTIDDALSGLGIIEQARVTGISVTSASVVLAPAAPPRLRTIRSRVLKALGVLLEILAIAYEPETIVIGGGVAESLGVWLPQLEDQLRADLSSAPAVCLSQIGDLAGTMGAVASALDATRTELGVDSTNLPTIPLTEDWQTLTGKSGQQESA